MSARQRFVTRHAHRETHRPWGQRALKVIVSVWVLLSHKLGDNEQCLALADLLNLSFDVRVLDWPEESSISDKALTMLFLEDSIEAAEKRKAKGICPPWPDVLICSGRRNSRVGFWIRETSKGHTKVVVIGRARRPVAQYDLLVAPPQFRAPTRSNVVKQLTPLRRRAAPSDLAPGDGADRWLAELRQPLIAVLVGGRVRQFLTKPGQVAKAIAAAAEQVRPLGGRVVVLDSRRTPRDVSEAIRQLTGEDVLYVAWSSGRRSAYKQILSRAEFFLVTGDSISMLSDACGTGKPTYIIELPSAFDARRWLDRVGSALFSGRFQEWLHARRIVRYARDLKVYHRILYRHGLARPVAELDLLDSGWPKRDDIKQIEATAENELKRKFWTVVQNSKA